MSWKTSNHAIYITDFGDLNITLNSPDTPTFRLTAKDGAIFESEMFTVNGRLQPDNFGHNMELFSNYRLIKQVSPNLFKIIFSHESNISVTFVKRVAKDMDRVNKLNDDLKLIGDRIAEMNLQLDGYANCIAAVQKQKPDSDQKC